MNRKEIFIYYSSPENWIATAMELNETINQLNLIKNKRFCLDTYHLDIETFARPFCSKSIYLLMSFAIENILKAMLILRKPELVNTGKIKDEIKSHNLILLLNKAEINLINEQIDFLKKLSHISVSTARYPIGLNENYEIQKVSILDKDYSIYENLFESIMELLLKEFNEKGWNSGHKNEKLNIKPGEFKYKYE
ncbi:hypothetical protein [Flavobacterium sp. HSC-61S13]|uniref:hypothetical protein n=1 Tax=Flavobacterium sp. HSC-61S13 TaxID=2910963 RepID=UPI00209F3A99|nr:hypothetical protein [Flavobacterium sp. HSC-61S13]MCP1997385.1 hypothetical protein [Flavobacterium sp. HSC-61S13]